MEHKTVDCRAHCRAGNRLLGKWQQRYDYMIAFRQQYG